MTPDQVPAELIDFAMTKPEVGRVVWPHELRAILAAVLPAAHDMWRRPHHHRRQRRDARRSGRRARARPSGLPPAHREADVSLRIVPMRFRDACGFVEMWHRHHRPPRGYKFCIGVADDHDVLCGIAIVGRPVARLYDDGLTLEVTRTATDGTPNANSMLYGAAWRAARALGYRRLVTYTQEGESGASLRAAGWRVVAERRPRPGWNMPSRPRQLHGTEGIPRTLWEAS